jgi:hypothetical protein
MDRLAVRATLALGVIVATLTAATAPAAADAVVATLERDTPVAAYGGVVAWSAFDASTDRYQLVLHQGGVTAAAPVAPAARPFDVSLGPDARGRVVAL